MGKSEVELKKQSKTKRRKNQKMELKEKWICPDAEVQLFTPQEYVAACYRIIVPCQSLGYISVPNDHSHSNGHNTTFTIKTDSSPKENPQLVINSLSSWRSATTSAKMQHLHNDQHSTEGFAWQDNGTWHFTTGNGNWFTSTEIPNAS